jgi:hypothetical protein
MLDLLSNFRNRSGVYFDTIIVPCASGSPLTGMIAGFKLIDKTLVEAKASKPKQA